MHLSAMSGSAGWRSRASEHGGPLHRRKVPFLEEVAGFTSEVLQRKVLRGTVRIFSAIKMQFNEPTSAVARATEFAKR